MIYYLRMIISNYIVHSSIAHTHNIIIVHIYNIGTILYCLIYIIYYNNIRVVLMV